jgi:hypothetical protein
MARHPARSWHPWLFCAASGCVWALIAYGLASTQMPRTIWGGLLVAPLVGLAVGALGRAFPERSRGGRLARSLVTLYVAVLLFGLACGLFDVWRGLPNGTARDPGEVVLQSVQAVLWGVTFTGYVLFLWPLAHLNHGLLERFRRSSDRPRLPAA